MLHTDGVSWNKQHIIPVCSNLRISGCETSVKILRFLVTDISLMLPKIIQHLHCLHSSLLHGLSLQANVITCVSTSCQTSKSYCTYCLSALYSCLLRLNAIVYCPAEHFAEELC